MKNGRGVALDSELLAKLISGLFPKGSRSSCLGGPGFSVDSYFAIPGRHGPRWVLPANPSHGRPALHMWRPYDTVSQIKWAFLMRAYRLGLLGLVPGVEKIGIVIPQKADWSHLGWHQDVAPKLAIYVGTPGRAQRAVASLVDPAEGQVLAIAKMPIGPAARTRILCEADFLERLAKEKPGLGPRALFRNFDSGITTEEALGGCRTGRELTAAHLQFLEQLRIPGQTICCRDVVARLRPGLARLSPENATAIGRILDGLDDPTRLPACWVHGDFAPWNLFRLGDRLIACDWEYAKPFGLPLFDAMHFMWIQRFLFSHAKTSGSLEGLLRPFDLPPEYLDQISKLYRCTILLTDAFPSKDYEAYLCRTLLNAPGP